MTGNDEDARELGRAIRRELEIVRQESPRATRDELYELKREIYQGLGIQIGDKEHEKLAEIRKSLEYVKDQIDLRKQLKNAGLTAIFLALVGIVVTAVMTYVKIPIGGK